MRATANETEDHTKFGKTIQDQSDFLSAENGYAAFQGNYAKFVKSGLTVPKVTSPGLRGAYLKKNQIARIKNSKSI